MVIAGLDQPAYEKLYMTGSKIIQKRMEVVPCRRDYRMTTMSKNIISLRIPSDEEMSNDRTGRYMFSRESKLILTSQNFPPTLTDIYLGCMPGEGRFDRLWDDVVSFMSHITKLSVYLGYEPSRLLLFPPNLRTLILKGVSFTRDYLVNVPISLTELEIRGNFDNSPNFELRLRQLLSLKKITLPNINNEMMLPYNLEYIDIPSAEIHASRFPNLLHASVRKCTGDVSKLKFMRGDHDGIVGFDSVVEFDGYIIKGHTLSAYDTYDEFENIERYSSRVKKIVFPLGISIYDAGLAIEKFPSLEELEGYESVDKDDREWKLQENSLIRLTVPWVVSGRIGKLRYIQCRDVVENEKDGYHLDPDCESLLFDPDEYD